MTPRRVSLRIHDVLKVYADASAFSPRKVKVLALTLADQQVKSLSSVLSRYQGSHGEAGGRKNCSGRSGTLLYVPVSPGLQSPPLRASWAPPQP